jgi:ketosteroid isomerase-like protein
VRTLRTFVVLFAISVLVPAPWALAQGDSKQDREISTVLDKQAVDWNRGDLEAFATGYKNSPDILFMGSPIDRGYSAMVARYHKIFSTREKMGVLSFSELEVQPLDERFVTVTGRFHLERTTAGGGNADGYYLLVMEKTVDGWKIIRDATTNLPKVAAK